MKYCKFCKRIEKDESAGVCTECKRPLSTFAGKSSSSASPQPQDLAGARAAGSLGASKAGGAADGAHTFRKPGPSASPGPGDQQVFYLQGQLKKLEEEKKKNTQKGRFFGLTALLSALSIMIFLFVVYSQTVLAYAVLDKIQVEQDRDNQFRMIVSYEVIKPGKIVFDRRNGSAHSEIVEIVNEIGPNNFEWTDNGEFSWRTVTDASKDLEFHVLYRGGWFRSSMTKHFALRGITF